MGTSLDTGRKPSGPPSAHLRNQGDHLNFMVIDINNSVPKTKFGSKELDKRDDGSQKFVTRVTALALGGNAVRVEGDTDVAVQPHEVVSIFIDSYSKWDPDNDKLAQPGQHVSWGAAVDNHVGGDLQVGTVGQQAYLRDIPSKQAGNNARKDRKFVLRAAKPEELELVQKCERLRIELQAEQAGPATSLDSGQPAPVGAGVGASQPDFGEF